MMKIVKLPFSDSFLEVVVVVGFNFWTIMQMTKWKSLQHFRVLKVTQENQEIKEQQVKR